MSLEVQVQKSKRLFVQALSIRYYSTYLGCGAEIPKVARMALIVPLLLEC